MTERVFLHIGLPKTGTTYLQRTLWENKDILTEAGLLLPGRHRRRHLLASLDVRDDPKLSGRDGDVRAPWDDLVAEALEWHGDVLVSHEFFGPASPDQVRRAVYRALYGDTALSKYGWSALPSIHIIVKNGNVTLEGVVDSESDKNLANLRANGVPNVFSVTNNLNISSSDKKT